MGHGCEQQTAGEGQRIAHILKKLASTPDYPLLLSTQLFEPIFYIIRVRLSRGLTVGFLVI